MQVQTKACTVYEKQEGTAHIMPAQVIHLIFDLYIIGLCVYVILPHFPKWREQRRFLEILTPYYEPLLDPIRRHIKATKFGEMMIDWSPLVLFFSILCIRIIVVGLFSNPK